MLLKWVTSEEALCPMRSYLEHYHQQNEDSKKRIDTHLARPHILLSALPNPAEPLEINLPSMVKRHNGALDIQSIANLWTQLLCIQTQNGNFMRRDKWSRANEGPKMCISQMNPDECAEVYRALKEADPPVDETVADLICSLPYASCNDECHKIAPCTMMPDPTSDRALFLGGPVLPPHLMRLTDWWGGNSGMLILVDVLTGNSIELKDYKPSYDDGDPHGKIMTEYNGPRKPIEDLLHEWIDNYLSARWIPDASMDIYQIEWRSMIFLEYKALFDEYDWPAAFPLPREQFDAFLKKHNDLSRRDFYEDQHFTHVWHQLTEAWYEANKAEEALGTDPKADHQTLRMLDKKIGEALRYEEARARDMAYASAVGVDIEERLKAPVSLHDSANIGDNWRIDVKAEDIMERFWDVIAFGPQILRAEDNDWSPSTKKEDVLEDMGKVMEAAYHRYLNPEEAAREARMVGVPDEDDDSTSDFEEDGTDQDEDGGDDSSDTMDGSGDEEEDDLDIEALQMDMADLDVEAIRAQLAGPQVSASDTQTSSQTLRGDESS